MTKVADDQPTPAPRVRFGERFNPDTMLARFEVEARKVLEPLPPVEIYPASPDTGMEAQCCKPVDPPFPVEDDAPWDVSAAATLMFWIDVVRKQTAEGRHRDALMTGIMIGQIAQTLALRHSPEIARLAATGELDKLLVVGKRVREGAQKARANRKAQIDKVAGQWTQRIREMRAKNSKMSLTEACMLLAKKEGAGWRTIYERVKPSFPQKSKG